MKNNLVSKKIMSVIIITILLLATKVYGANDKFSTTLNTNNFQVKREDNIIITIGLKDIAIESGEKGIGAYTASIKFDSSVLEYVSTNGTDKWEAPFYQNGLITGNTKDGEVVNTAQGIGTITFKVKNDAKLGETAIELTNFSGSTAVTDVSTSDESIKVTIVDNNNNINNNGNNNNGSDNNSQTGNNNNANANNNSNENSSTSTSKPNIPNSNMNNEKDNIKQDVLPKTGTTNITIFIVIGICILLAVFFFIKMRGINKK